MHNNSFQWGVALKLLMVFEKICVFTSIYSDTVPKASGFTCKFPDTSDSIQILWATEINKNTDSKFISKLEFKCPYIIDKLLKFLPANQSKDD